CLVPGAGESHPVPRAGASHAVRRAGASHAVPGAGRSLGPVGYRLVRAASIAAAVWALAALGSMVFTLADLLGAPAAAVVTPRSLYSFATTVSQGRALTVVVAAALIVAVAAGRVLTTGGAAMLTLIAVAAVLPPALT